MLVFLFIVVETSLIMMMKTHKVGMVFSRLKRAFICKILSYTCIALSESNIRFDEFKIIIII